MNLRNITLHIQLRKQNGKNVRLHVPLSVVQICVEKNLEPAAVLGNSWLVKKLDLREILNRVQSGERGTVWHTASKAGDTLEVIAE